MLVPPGAVDVDIHQNREGRAHPSPFTVTRLHALFPACKFDRPLIVEALARLRSRSCIIDGEAVACDDSGIARFNRIRYRRYDDTVFLYAFDLIELNGDDLRRDPLQVRKATLISALAKAGPASVSTNIWNATMARRLPPRLQDGARRHRVEAQGLALPLRPLARLAQDEEPGVRGGEARSRRGLGTVKRGPRKPQSF